MTSPLRLVFAVTLLGLTLSACGGGAVVQEELAVAAAPNTAIEDPDTLMATFMADSNQAEVAGTINDARRGGQTDLEIAETLGHAYLRAPRRRVMFSVTYIHFREGSAAESAALDAAYELGRTPPAERAEEEAAAAAPTPVEPEPEEEEAEEEDEEPRQRGWRRWVPGL